MKITILFLAGILSILSSCNSESIIEDMEVSSSKPISVSFWATQKALQRMGFISIYLEDEYVGDIYKTYEYEPANCDTSDFVPVKIMSGQHKFFIYTQYGMRELIIDVKPSPECQYFNCLR